jgi:AcrR family transcriptional regulator
MDAPNAADDASEATDPRIRRSRRMLQDALATLLTAKDFDRISIQDIAEASTLNRATFYDHYPDKFTLLQCMVARRFSELMALRNVRVEDCASGLRAIALGVCDYLAEAPANGGRSHEGSMQTAVVGVMRRMLLEGLRDHVFDCNVSPEVVAATVSWAIYGAASAWIQSRRCSAEQMADVINRLVQPVILAAAEDGQDAGAPHR